MFKQWLERALASVAGTEQEPRAESRVIDGIRVDVINTREDVDTERVFRRAEAVIARVAEYKPCRLAHIRRAAAGILVQLFACRAAFFGDTHVIMLELTFMAN